MKAFIIFEDDLYNNFYPLSLTRPVWDLRTGIFSFRERWERALHRRYGEDAPIFYFCRPQFVPWYHDAYPQCEVNNYGVFYKYDEFIFLNAATFPTGDTPEPKENRGVLFRNQPVAARITAKKLNRSAESILSMIKNSSVRMADAHSPQEINGLGKACYIWEMVTMNSRMIGEDFQYIRGGIEEKTPADVTILGDGALIAIGKDVRIEPYVFIDSRNGPVVIDEGAEINAFSRIEGPAYVGKRSRILGAKIRKGCSIGEDCRIGGEVEESIFHAHANKYHEGFIGHSYIGEWVNLGAMTTNSDLKNTYKDVKVYIPEVRKNSGSNKIGCFMGDHVKTSIGTLINTGASIGTGAMLVHSGSLTPHHVPPFSWHIRGAVESPSWFDDFLNTARIVMERRGLSMTPPYEALLKDLYHQYKHDERRS